MSHSKEGEGKRKLSTSQYLQKKRAKYFSPVRGEREKETREDYSIHKDPASVFNRQPFTELRVAAANERRNGKDLNIVSPR